MRFIFVLFALLFSSTSFAIDLSSDGFQVNEVYMHTISRHFSNNGIHNNDNFGMGVRFKNNLITGAYYNSLYRPTTYIAYAYDWRYHITFIGGVATGYQYALLPAAAIQVSYPITKNWVGAVNVVPVTGGVVHLTIGYKWR